jgi:hypothetical protein
MKTAYSRQQTIGLQQEPWRAANVGRPPRQMPIIYWPSWDLIIASTCLFTASRLNEAGSCIGG